MLATSDHGLRSYNRLAVSATNHCLTGCVIGEVTGMVIGTALGWGDVASIALAVGLAFLFGYTLTSIPLLRSGLPLAAVVPIALTADFRRGKGHAAAHTIMDNARPITFSNPPNCVLASASAGEVAALASGLKDEGAPLGAPSFTLSPL